jgi:uncharacterized protein
MSPSRPFRGLWRARVLAVSLALAATGAGCASTGGTPLPNRPSASALAPGSPLLSRTLPEGDAWLRHYLINADHDAALDVLRRSAARPSDRLLGALQEGVVLHYAGRHAESNRVFEWAEQEADRRFTRSVSRGIGSVVVNDLVLAYMPSAGELAIIPYYRMLNYLALGQVQGAAVEARKSSAYLARLTDRKQGGCQGFGLVQYLAGHVYAAAGERNDALVSMRQAERSFSECGKTGIGSMPPGFPADLLHAALALGLPEVADSVAERYGIEARPLGADEADLIVLVEHGFAAHRVQQDLHVPILKSELGDLAEGQSASALAVAGQITTRLATTLLTGADPHRMWDQTEWNLALEPQRAYADDLVLTRHDIGYVLRLAWPVMRLEASRAPRARLLVDGEAVDAPALEDVSARLVGDLESRRNAILARMVARGMVKYVASREAGEAAEKKGGELLGTLVEWATNAAGNMLEQADTRSWSLLPDQISVARLRVPAGERQVQIEVMDSRGMVNRIVDLGTVDVQPGARVVLSRRVWGAEAGDRDRLIQLGLDVYGRSDVPTPVLAAPPVRRASRTRPRRPPAATPAPPAQLPPRTAPVGTVPVGAAPPPPVIPNPVHPFAHGHLSRNR